MENNNTFDSIRIGLASPDMIRKWSYGEVKKPETINYRSLKAERDGLFCERIFGPTKDWECQCGKYKRIRHKNKVCEKCGVEVTQKKVRRERMGHIELAAPVSHIWYLKAIPSRMGLLLDITPRNLEHVIYFSKYIVIDPGKSPLEKNQLLTDKEYEYYKTMYENEFRVGMGAEAIKELLQNLDIEALSKELHEELEKINNAAHPSAQKKAKVIKRLEVVEAFRKSGNKPEWMILDTVPVIPPDIRPMVQLDGGRFATSDLNDLYRRVIIRNNRLAKFMESRSPAIVINNEKRMLQDAVDALIDNGRRGKPVTGPNNRTLKSLSEMLRGKQGRFRQNLLGKRVDYSGRSVIVVGPSLKIYQCGLPKEMALELFKPFVMRRLTETGKASNIKEAKKKVERSAPEVWDALEVVIKEHPVLLNRAPTLHRLSIQAFEPVLVEGRAIKLHPLVCKAFNADFDGDQMPIHVPLSAEAQAEARFLMLSANNLLKPVDGRAITVPSQDMVLGSYYLTIDRAGEPGEGKVFKDENEAMMAYHEGVIGIHAPIKVRVSGEYNGETVTRIIDCTIGKLIFNKNIPQNLGYVDRTDPDKCLDIEIDFKCGSKQLGQIIDRSIKINGFEITAEMLDKIKATGYQYSTKASISISVADMVIPPKKYEIVAEADKKVDAIHKEFMRGKLTENERYRSVIQTWEVATKDVVNALQENFDTYNPIKMMSDSGARGNMTQMRQLAGIRGLMFKTSGETMEVPIKSNFREGLNILEYFIAARGARKALSDTALKTADSGYLTRRLVDVSQDVIIRETDCGSTHGLWVTKLMDGNETIETISQRVFGRYVIGDVVDPTTGEVIVEDNTMVSEEQAKAIEKAGIEKVHLRTVLQCKARHGVCTHCYGADLASSKPVNIGEAVGIIAAQSIGEPGTQLTMRTFHTGGVAGANITQGLPRVEELFEARKPKKPAILSEIDGTVEVRDVKKIHNIVVTNTETGETKEYPVPYGTQIIVMDDQAVVKGQELTEGYKAPTDILNINGIDAVYDYIISEVQKVYSSQSIGINDKHIEIITRQMTRKCKIVDPGDTDFLPDTNVDKVEFENQNEIIRARIAAGETELKEATASDSVLLGITKAAIQCESFLSAASFQETTKVLTEAAIKGKVDHLQGLKENVLIGKLIPAGTGMPCYNNVEVEKINSAEDDAFYAKYANINVKENVADDDDILDDDEDVTTSTEMYSEVDTEDDEVIDE